MRGRSTDSRVYVTAPSARLGHTGTRPCAAKWEPVAPRLGARGDSAGFVNLRPTWRQRKSVGHVKRFECAEARTALVGPRANRRVVVLLLANQEISCVSELL
jgi:hypothetical protein